MRLSLAFASAWILSGCEQPFDYSSCVGDGKPRLEGICQVDARLRSLLGDPAPDPSRLRSVLDSLGAGFRTSDSDPVSSTRGILESRGIAPDLHPSDSDLVPSLAWERRRAGCVPLALFWTTSLRARGIQAQPALLPGHVVVRLPDGTFLETLRGGIPRSAAFYDSAFSLGRRPYYARIAADSNAVLASLLVQAGLLEWKSRRLASAESAFRTAALLCPGLPEAEGNLGLVLAARHRPDSAKIRLHRALQGDPRNLRAFRILDSLENGTGAEKVDFAP